MCIYGCGRGHPLPILSDEHKAELADQRSMLRQMNKLDQDAQVANPRVVESCVQQVTGSWPVEWQELAQDGQPHDNCKHCACHQVYSWARSASNCQADPIPVVALGQELDSTSRQLVRDPRSHIPRKYQVAFHSAHVQTAVP
jgi:hypothetical protein